MKNRKMLCLPLIVLLLALPYSAAAEQQPEMVVEKMVTKLARGITNIATCVIEIPKQSVLTVRDIGGAGYVVGPLKGIGMTVYRAIIGAAETAFFLVPQPGYYDPMIDPPYVWEGWEARGETTPPLEEEIKQ